MPPQDVGSSGGVTVDFLIHDEQALFLSGPGAPDSRVSLRRECVFSR